MVATQQMKAVSSIYHKTITRQTIINGKLVTEFQEDPDPIIGHPAGTLICEPCTQSERIAYEERYGEGLILSETVTRFRRLFWDMGEFTPKSN